MTATPMVSVVVPYYRRADQLDRLLAGLDEQTYDPERTQVVVADDGSPETPDVGGHAFATLVVRQDDDGFRAAAARNLGARAATGDVLVFLDQDCVPAPDYLGRVAAAAADPWSLVVGHRRHAALDGWPAGRVRSWLRGAGDGPEVLAEPQWLLEGYARTADLAEPDDRSYQLVISAVLSMHRQLFDRLGGFDGSLRGYGGEDWELAHRALVAGADLHHLPDAVVWHDGPDLAGRPEDLTRTKNAETLALAPRLPDTDVRGSGLVWRRPEVVVRLDVTGSGAAGVMASVESLLVGTDAHVWLGDGPVAAEVLTLVEDPRVHLGAPTGEVLASARYLVEGRAVVVQGGTLHELCRHAPVAVRGFRLARTRDENRAARGLPVPPDHALPPGITVEVPESDPVLERLWQARVTSR